MENVLLIDIGSTFTKACAFDLEGDEVLATAMTPSTVKTDVCEGIEKVIIKIQNILGEKSEFKLRLACSSAAGGLRMIVVGLVPDLTTEAGRHCALGAGAKVISAYSYKVNETERDAIEEQKPDIILMVGGTDGGNEEVLLSNARVLSQLNLNVPIIIAGNKNIAYEAKDILVSNGKIAQVTSNVLPEIGKFNFESARERIRNIFVERIIVSKGFKKVERYVDGNLIPTPLAVFEAIKILSTGTEADEGWGDLIGVDIGGATTDVYSAADGLPGSDGTMLGATPPPFYMRTVEGDLGLRYNAQSILKELGDQRVLENIGIQKIDLEKITRDLSEEIARIPGDKIDKAVDVGLARSAMQLAVKRHAGHIETIYTPVGRKNVQYGKDLTGVKFLVATGGIFIYSDNSERLKILEGALFDQKDGLCLLPKEPSFYVDEKYILFGIGLLSHVYPDKSVRILKRYLKKMACLQS